MVYDKDYYELLTLIENKIQSIKNIGKEINLSEQIITQLENIEKTSNQAVESIEKLMDVRGFSEKSFENLIHKYEEYAKIEKSVNAAKAIGLTVSNDLLIRQKEIEVEIGEITDENGVKLNLQIDDAKDIYDEYSKQADILEDQRRELLKIEKQNKKILEQTKEWKENVDNIKKGYQQFTSNLKKSFNIIKDSTEFWRKQDEQITKMVATFGLTTEEFKKYRDASYKAGVELAYQYGKTQEDLVKLQQGYAEATGKNIILTKDNYEAQFQLQQLMGEENSLAFTSGIEQFGVGINDARDRLYDIYKLNKSTGVSWSKTSKDLNNNLKLAQKYNFKGGLDNMMRMTVWANKMKINLQTIGSIADKISNPEGAIETAAKLQVLGGAFSSMANPLQMLYESLDDVGGLAQRIEKMFDGLGRFDRELGEVRIAGPDRMRVKAAAEAMGMSYEEAMGIVNNKAKREAVEQDVRFNPEITKENRDFLATLGQWNNTNKQFEVRTFNEDKKQFETKNINELSNEDIEKLRQEPDEDIKKLVERTFSIDENIKQLALGINSQKAAYQDGFREFTMSSIHEAKDVLSKMDFLGGLLTNIQLAVAAIALGVSMKGVGTMFKGFKGAKAAIGKGAALPKNAGMFETGVYNTMKGGWKGAGKSMLKGAGVGAVVGAAFTVNDILNANKTYDERMAARSEAIRNGTLKPGSAEDKRLVKEINSQRKKGRGSAIGSGIGGVIGGALGSFIPIPVVGTMVGGAIGSYVGGAIGKWWASDNEDNTQTVDDGIANKRTVIKANKDDTALFAKDNGPFDKLFGNIIPKIDNIDNELSDSKGLKRNGNKVYGNTTNNQPGGFKLRNKAMFGTNSELLIKDNEHLNKMFGNIVPKIDKNLKISNELYYNNKINDRNVNITKVGDNKNDIIIPKPIGEDFHKIKETPIKDNNSLANIKLPDINVKPIELKLGGSLKLDMGSAGQVDIMKELKGNPTFMRELSRMLVEQMSSSLNGGKPKLDQNRFARFQS